MKFQPKGPKRFDHQRRGLQKMIQTGGVTALLFDPGLGKTAVVLDYASLLALKAPSGEARVLVVAPLAAVDTWVMQADLYVSDQVNVWAEALGGSIRQRAEALAARGGLPTRRSPARGPKDSWQGPRAAHWEKSFQHFIRSSSGQSHPSEGPDTLGTDKPRLVLISVNLDTMATRQQVCRKHWEGSCKECSAKTLLMSDAILEGIRRFAPDLVVVDESHKIKGVTANASRLLARVTDFVNRRVLLTGTVMPHSPLDVFAQWRFLEPYAFGVKGADGSVRRATFGPFKEKHIAMGGFMGREVVGYHNLDEMNAIMAKNAVVARKEESLDLPPTTLSVLPVMLNGAEKKAYKDLTDNLYADLPSGRVTIDNWLTRAMRLRQITSGYMPDAQGTRQVVGQSKVNTIRSQVQDVLVGEKRIVIFSYFTDEIDLLKQALSKEKGTEIMVITGGTVVSDRIAMRQRFGSKDSTRMVMIAQVKTMSLAVNELVTASHAIFGSLSRQRDDIVQAIDRLNRIGQTRPVSIWFALAPGTVDEVIYKSYQERTNLESAMLAHISKVHEEGL